jgi:hypothetical protein
MKVSRVDRKVLCACTAVLMLAGCASQQLGTPPLAGSGGETGMTPLSVERLAALTMPHFAQRPVHRDLGKSWMIPEKGVNGPQLLYVADWASDDVWIYGYPGDRVLGKLTGFNEPYGMCVDAPGNIWVTNFAASTIVEYTHGGTSPLQTLATKGSPIGCSVSGKGNLAVANFSIAGGDGDIQLFKGETGTPKDYSNTACGKLWSPGYDLTGNLYVEGQAKSGAAICEISSTGKAKLKKISFNKTISSPGGVMWDGKFVTLTDQEGDGMETPVMYRAKETTSGDLKVAGNTQLTDTCDGNYVDLPQPFVIGKLNTPVNHTQGTLVVGGNLLCHGRFDYWAYPWPSGDPIVTLTKSPAQPYGQVYSRVSSGE